jgi:prenyltransferase beta subunit
MSIEEPQPLDGIQGEPQLDGFHSLMEIFDELSFREKWHKVFEGLKEPIESGQHKWARLQCIRLSAPAAAVVVPLLVLVLLVTLGFLEPPRRTYTVEVKEPEPIEELEEIEKIEEEIIPPEDFEIPDDVVITEMTDDVSPPMDFSPQPAPLDSVALTKSPVVLRGILGSRNPGARGSLLGRHGGSGLTEHSVLLALRWLKKNQNSDGSWDNVKPAMTALALLTYLAHNETPASEEFGATVERAIKWMLENQEGSGHFNGRDGHDYSQPIAAYALCETYAMTKIPMVKDAAERAISIIVSGQHASGGWNYNCDAQDRDDTSYMGWCAQALKAAKLSGIEVEGVDTAMRRAIAGFKKNYSGGEYGSFGYTEPGRTGLTGAGALCLQLLGAAKSPEAKGAMQTLAETTFNWEGGGTFNQNYYWYYITQAKFHEGGNTWNTWNKMFSPVLVKRQTIIPKAIEDAHGKLVDIGFWDMNRELSGHTDGVVMNTCLAALQLQVYYRYLPTYQTPTELPEEELEFTDDSADVDIQIL